MYIINNKLVDWLSACKDIINKTYVFINDIDNLNMLIKTFLLKTIVRFCILLLLLMVIIEMIYGCTVVKLIIV